MTWNDLTCKTCSSCGHSELLVDFGSNVLKKGWVETFSSLLVAFTKERNWISYFPRFVKMLCFDIVAKKDDELKAEADSQSKVTHRNEMQVLSLTKGSQESKKH